TIIVRPIVGSTAVHEPALGRCTDRGGGSRPVTLNCVSSGVRYSASLLVSVDYAHRAISLRGRDPTHARLYDAGAPRSGLIDTGLESGRGSRVKERRRILKSPYGTVPAAMDMANALPRLRPAVETSHDVELRRQRTRNARTSRWTAKGTSHPNRRYARHADAIFQDARHETPRHRPVRPWFKPWRKRCACGCAWFPCPDSVPLAAPGSAPPEWNRPTVRCFWVLPALKRPLLTRGQQWRTR
ncbi:MAG: hypothetical protein QOH97_2426, partial [Actinoplanes sp.]|nr:hypothetical protein [Actinoplanes sp.]